MASTFGLVPRPGWEEDIERMRAEFDQLHHLFGLRETPKIHMLLQHVPDFIRLEFKKSLIVWNITSGWKVRVLVLGPNRPWKVLTQDSRKSGLDTVSKTPFLLYISPITSMLSFTITGSTSNQSLYHNPWFSLDLDSMSKFPMSISDENWFNLIPKLHWCFLTSDMLSYQYLSISYQYQYHINIFR